ncbi:hypothetical protein FHG64_10950 [Antarcticibacterium flavum]|uniref:Uncharacterized protein n=1 Tax=Antarcticibacterium flavum TaxID=2058175 RepID=A0A5B7X2Z1_9FLAO|nr:MULTISPECIES: hypothetical protein [Antarcticibacterium]MCM4159490.1 hypothetical protein [Antarcticibacterium sp. W02-3]QCY69876.1 hypothetical protein FHG64_10950 [Antarcticibacterium flavum]
MHYTSPHSFHIPVMGIAFTIDSPFKVARYGITSAISIIEDNLIEVMRKYYYQQNNEPYFPITPKEEDYRARRITDYLDLMNRNVQEQLEKLKSSAFEMGSDIAKYFEMLPDSNALKQKYREFLHLSDPEAKKALEEELRKNVQPGSIEVNIMTKVDKNNLDEAGVPRENGSDALEALKGYAKSDLSNSSVVFSAGMNPRLYNYLENFREFDALGWGQFKKKIAIKVSDYRSALIQGKYLAKKGIWVSEFRIESGLNCGGHAFATQGILMGPILEEFRSKREELAQELFILYNPAIQERGQEGFENPHPIKITVQGGIGTAEEDSFLRNHYRIDSTGWGTPFLLCPEATTVDQKTMEVLCKAEEKDIVLSKASPLGVPFNYLKGTTAEKERLDRITRGKPGSPCTEKFLVSNTEFTKEPICTASKKYQKLKLQELQTADLQEDVREQMIGDLLSKECLCIGLSNAAPVEYREPFLKKLDAVTICPGPNISNFSKISSLNEMIDHIYGRAALELKKDRPHMFVRELQLYISYLKDEMKSSFKSNARMLKSWNSFLTGLTGGVEYYRQLVEQSLIAEKEKFLKDLQEAEDGIGELFQKVQQISFEEKEKAKT